MSAFSASVSFALGLTLLLLVGTQATRLPADRPGTPLDRANGDIHWV